MNTMTDSQKILAVCDFLKKTPYKLAAELGYKNPSSVYHVRDSVAPLSETMAKKIIVNFPAINYQFLKGNADNVALDFDEQTNQANFVVASTVKGSTFLEKFQGLLNDVEMIKQQNLQILELLLRQES